MISKLWQPTNEDVLKMYTPSKAKMTQKWRHYLYTLAFGSWIIKLGVVQRIWSVYCISDIFRMWLKLNIFNHTNLGFGLVRKSLKNQVLLFLHLEIEIWTFRIFLCIRFACSCLCLSLCFSATSPTMKRTQKMEIEMTLIHMTRALVILVEILNNIRVIFCKQWLERSVNWIRIISLVERSSII